MFIFPPEWVRVGVFRPAIGGLPAGERLSLPLPQTAKRPGELAAARPSCWNLSLCVYYNILHFFPCPFQNNKPLAILVILNSSPLEATPPTLTLSLTRTHTHTHTHVETTLKGNGYMFCFGFFVSASFTRVNILVFLLLVFWLLWK